MDLRDNWRIVLLVVLVLLSTGVLFAPGGSSGGGTGNATDGQVARGTDMTNLQYGLELSGGTRLRAGLVGVTAESVPMAPDEADPLERTVASQLGLDPIDVTVRPQTEEQGTVEVFDANATQEGLRDALAAADVNMADVTIRDGVTAQTRTNARNVLTDKINRGGLTGGGASLVTTATGDQFLVVEVPNANRTEVLELIEGRGRVQVVATFPDQTANGTVYRRVPLLTQGDFTSIGPPREGQGNEPPYVSVSLRPDAAENFSNAMRNFGFVGEGQGNCRWRESPDDPGWCLQTVIDEEVTFAASMGDLATDIRQGTFVNNPTFTITTGNFSTAQQLKLNLEAGALPTDLDIQSQVSIAPSLAQRFKPLALFTGLFAWITVAGVIFWRYREIRVAIPMLLTAAAEVWLLLGFAAAIGLALDLSHIAGLIAVIGTGVDDLVIIADEILQRGEIATDRVFRNRFRKAFWVIGAAAITTIIAMSPLAVLSLGDLQGFAIVTIVGVLIGVLITRPAYGDVLRNLLIAD